MKLIVFIGPTISLEEARTLLDADYRPPVVGGDIARVMHEHPDGIAIIDGLFEQVASVRHKEILYALSRGVPVYGASSMGALRAAELAAFGMIGVGQIFERYVRGEYEDDDEVAISHATAEFGFRALSDAMVSIRWGLDLALESGVISAPTLDALTSIAKAAYYPDRTWALLWERGATAGLPRAELAALREFVLKRRPDRKKEDARALLERLRVDFAGEPPRHEPNFDLESPFEFEDSITRPVRQEIGLAKRSKAGVTARALGRYVRVWGSPDLDELRVALSMILLADKYAEFDSTVSNEVRASVRDQLAEFGEFDETWLERAAAATELEATYLTGSRARSADEATLLACLRDPRMMKHHDALASRTERLRARGELDATPEQLNVSEAELVEWYEKRAHAPSGTAAEHAARLGLSNARDFLAEVFAAYLVARST